jgi:hypothetical protein
LSYRPRRKQPLEATRNGAGTPYNVAGDPAMLRSRAGIVQVLIAARARIEALTVITV